MILDLVMRPTVLFDPNNKQHREHYANFLKLGSWGRCPVRFEVEGENQNNNLAYAMQRMMAEYYTLKEFKGVAKEPQTLVRQKKKVVVDNSVL
jgi:hypothetical protein